MTGNLKSDGLSSEVICLSGDGRDVHVKLKHNIRAKRYILRVPVDGDLPVLTVPKGGTVKTAQQFAQRQYMWLLQKLERTAERIPFDENALIPLRGLAHTIRYSGNLRGLSRSFIDEGEKAVISISGAPESIQRKTLEFLKKQASADLQVAVLKHCASLQLSYKSISLKDTKSRWGSCSSDGRLSFSWRLILAPPFVLDYVAAHEVAHLVKMDHSPEFWHVCEKLAPQTPEAKQWLRQNGAKLHLYG
ncbi:M48 family metallopeptidase [Flexibacterium corallicola]|uniref:M48 family metallopeptidase n=1 Tax=Flexibacterium corallicola TaxID=3037259 RepID=UPI00286F67DD|nr:SprT family zinc-dependent metalloprotease [Pseudovibrio sp. M1P-2-3]